MLNLLRRFFGVPLVAPRGAAPPHGTFEVIGERCLGIVVDATHPHHLPLRVVVETVAGDLLKVVELAGSPNHSRYEFSFDLDGVTKGLNLLKEQTSIHAINGFGCRGRLSLDGASQLSLIRQHLGEPRILIFDIDFTAGGSATQFMHEGWSKPEKAFCWTNGKQARLVIPAVIDRTARYELTLTCRPLLIIPFIESQAVIVTLNGYAQAVKFDTKSLGFASFVYPAESLPDSEVANITFDLPDASQPLQSCVENIDTRLLALAFKNISLARLLPEGDSGLAVTGLSTAPNRPCGSAT